MKKTSQKVIVITGPTATGKSALAVEIAKLFNGEIISADSRQVYRGLDIGTAKITPAGMQGIPHHLLDVADPREIFTVAEFQKLAAEKITEVHGRGKLPILCGGTGMYISAIIDGIEFPEVPPNEKLREELEALGPAELFNRLQKLDPKRAETIDQNNPRRLIRAIEVAEALGSVPSLEFAETKYEVLMIGLELPKEELVQRIKERIDVRIPTLFDEIKKLNEEGVTWERMKSFGLEYRYGAEYVQGKITLEEFKETLATKTWQYVKRQMTWFKRDPRIQWMNPISDKQKILSLVENFTIS